MGATLIVDDSELALVLSGIHLPISEGWKAELAYKLEEVGRSVVMTSTGNRTLVAYMEAKWFTHNVTAAESKNCNKRSPGKGSWRDVKNLNKNHRIFFLAVGVGKFLAFFLVMRFHKGSQALNFLV